MNFCPIADQFPFLSNTTFEILNSSNTRSDKSSLRFGRIIMQAKGTWFSEKAFGEEAAGLVTVSYKSHKEALYCLETALNTTKGVGLLQGPDGSGKTVTARRLEEMLPGDCAVAFIDGTRIKANEMMSEMLKQFGYDTDLETDYELESMVKMFATQQTVANQPPVLIVDNVDRMYPSALRALNNFAELQIQDRYAMRMILTGRDGLDRLVASDGMPSVKNREAGSFPLRPLTIKEVLIYLNARLTASGVNDAETVFPVDVSDRIYKRARGWPGAINKAAIEALERTKRVPPDTSDTIVKDRVTISAPDNLPVLDVEKATAPPQTSLIITKGGKVVSEFSFTNNKVLIGRSDFADVVLDDQYTSKMHALLLLFSDALVLLDLNSSNGTTVNSVVTRSTILKSDDIISLGDHRLKVRNAPAISDEMAQLRKSPDTIKMKNLVEMRRHREQRLALVTSESKRPG
jgi:type II secretory pathway predicted ATPase ExeA